MPFPAVNPALARALLAREYTEPTPVQSAVLVAEAERRDLLVSAQTGSGKTVAYGLAIAPTLLGEAERFGQPGAPLALVIAPTRELAMQVKGELSWLYGQTGGRIASCVGGMDPRAEQRVLAAGCNIVVGTPGRLRDHLERGRLDLSQIHAAVLDEADEMLDLGFREDLETLLEATPPTRRTLLFSATIPKEIAALARAYQHDSLRIDVGARDEPHGDIEYRAVPVAPHDIERAAVNVLRYFEARAALVFCATREGVRRLHGALVERGFDAVALSGELSQHERTSALQALRDGRSRVCVATDVAARGLDLPALDLVIHADLPTNKETMLHRSGRTGRAGRKGVSVLLVPFPRRRRAEQLLASAGVDAGWSDPPSAELIRERDQERLLADPLLGDEPAEEDLELGRLLVAASSPERVAAGLAQLWRSKLPAPEESFAPAPAPARRAGPAATGRGAWFRLSVGRRNNADPRWLIPLICRLGGITKAEIGTIRIFERETRFELAAEAAPRFAQAVRQAGAHEPRIEPAPPVASRPMGPRRHAGPRQARAARS
ncbi:MAG: DEAD/DEAH box helicase [Acetobacteraceae bacterium]|nr:DEAD/DEAH box helicase [Acetobacteraceae bacterium]